MVKIKFQLFLRLINLKSAKLEESWEKINHSEMKIKGNA
jgi:hypothetical protein